MFCYRIFLWINMLQKLNFVWSFLYSANIIPLCRYITTSSLIGLNTKCKGMHWSKYNTMIIHPTNRKKSEWGAGGAWIAEICMIGSIHVIECTDANISCAALVTFYAKLYYIYQQAPTLQQTSWIEMICMLIHCAALVTFYAKLYYDKHLIYFNLFHIACLLRCY